jgi:hypothetical protein
VTEETDFDPRLDEYVSDEKAEKPLLLEVWTRFERPKPNGEFITVRLDENPAKIVKIGANLPLRIQEALTRCLRANTDCLRYHTRRNVRNQPRGGMSQPQHQP